MRSAKLEDAFDGTQDAFGGVRDAFDASLTTGDWVVFWSQSHRAFGYGTILQVEPGFTVTVTNVVWSRTVVDPPSRFTVAPEQCIKED